MPLNDRKASGCLFGLAIGDALAAPTEFLSLDSIIRQYGQCGPSAPSKYVTDDTQMALAVGEALIAAAQFQAALTHGHPTALTASDLTATAIADLAAGGDPAGLPGRLRAFAISQRRIYHEQ